MTEEGISCAGTLNNAAHEYLTSCIFPLGEPPPNALRAVLVCPDIHHTPQNKVRCDGIKIKKLQPGSSELRQTQRMIHKPLCLEFNYFYPFHREFFIFFIFLQQFSFLNCIYSERIKNSLKKWRKNL